MSFSMQIKQSSPEAVVIQVEGEVDILTANHLLAEIEKHDMAKIVLDCSGLVFIDSTGIGLLLRKIGELAENGRSLTFESIPEPIHMVFDEMGIYEILEEFGRR